MSTVSTQLFIIIIIIIIIIIYIVNIISVSLQDNIQTTFLCFEKGYFPVCEELYKQKIGVWLVKTEELCLKETNLVCHSNYYNYTYLCCL